MDHDFVPKITKLLGHIRLLLYSRPWLIKLVKFGLIATPMYFMGRNLYKNWLSLQEYQWSFDPFIAGLSFFFILSAFLLLPLSTRKIMRIFNNDLDYSTAYRAYFLTQMAKYLPGGLWIIPGRMLVLSEYRVNGRDSLAGMLTEISFLILSGTMISTLYLFYRRPGIEWIVGSLGVVFFVLLFLYKRNRAQRMYWDIAKKINLISIIHILLIYILFWVSLGTGFFLLADSFFNFSHKLWPAMVGVFSLSWIAGFIIFLTPGGLGVREGAIVFLLNPFMPSSVAILIAIIARVWWSIAEAILILIAFMFQRRSFAHIKTDKFLHKKPLV